MAHHPDCQPDLDRLEQHLRVKGRARTTILTYARAMRDLMAYHHAEADAISKQELLDFLAHRQQQVGAATLHQIASAIKYFYGKVLADPQRVIELPIPRKSKQLGELLTSAELLQLIGAAKCIRHRVVIELLFGLGLRAGEIGGIRRRHFDKIHATLSIVTAKGGRSRLLPYGGRLRQTLNDYFRAHEPKDYLIPAGFRSQQPGITVRGVQYIVRQTLATSGLQKKVCPHTLRHCFAVHYLNNGGSVLRLQQLLGHAHISTTWRYLSYATIPLKEVDSPLDFLFGRDKNFATSSAINTLTNEVAKP